MGLYDDWDAKRGRADPDGPIVPTATGTTATTKYGKRALESELARLALATKGTRNHTLNEVAFNIYQLTDAGHIDLNEAEPAIGSVARRIGLTSVEIAKTMRSARDGAERKRRREVPDPAAPVEHRPVADVRFDPAEHGGVYINGHAVPSTAVEVPGDDDPVRDIPPALDWHELWADDREEEWIIEPILAAERLVAVYSEPKIGKSLISLEIAAGIATGRPVLGGTPDRAYRVLYVDFENDPRGDVRERLRDMGYGPDDLANISYLSFPALHALDTERGGQQLMLTVERYGAEVVIIDTVSRAIAGEENANDTWLNFYRRTGLKLKQARVALLRLDHSGKDPAKGQRGGSAKLGDVDVVWRLSKVTESVFRFDCEAARMPIPQELRTITMHRRGDPLRHEVDATGWRAALGAQIEQLVRILDDAGIPDGAGFKLCKKAKNDYVAANPTFGASDEKLRMAMKQRQKRLSEGVRGDLENEHTPHTHKTDISDGVRDE